MNIFSEINCSLIKNHQSVLEAADLIIIDGNPPTETIRMVLNIAANFDKPGIFLCNTFY